MNSRYSPLIGEAQQCCPEQDELFRFCGFYVFVVVDVVALFLFFTFVCLFFQEQGEENVNELILENLRTHSLVCIFYQQLARGRTLRPS